MALEIKRGEDSHLGEEENSKNSRLFFFKEFFDRLGYGFGSQQFLNIILYQMSTSLFLVGTISGLRVFISAFISLALSSYSISRNAARKLMSASGILFGFCFLFIAIAFFLNSIVLFVFSLLLGSVGIVAYGNLYQELLKDILRAEKRGRLFGMIAYYGILITVFSFLLGGLLMDIFPASGTDISLNLLGAELPVKVFGYLVVFELAAIFFILSGYIFSFVKSMEKDARIAVPLRLNVWMEKIAKNRLLLFLMVSSLLLSVAQILANAYYGIFIYQAYSYTGFGFFIVAALFSTALLTSMIGPFISKMNSRLYGKIPMIVFGTLLMAITPLTYYYNPTFIPIAMATMLGMIGSVIVGVEDGLLLADFLREDEIKEYFRASSTVISASCLVLVPAGALFAQV